MTEAEARRIFDQKLPLCEVLGLDVRATCIAAGVPADLVDKFLAKERTLNAAMGRVIRDPSVLPAGGGSGTGVGTGVVNVGFVCLKEDCTGLPMIIWVMERGDAKRKPYLRVQADHSPVPRITHAVDISIDRKPRVTSGQGLSPADEELVSGFIRQNLRALRDYWTGAVNSEGLVRRICRSAGPGAARSSG
jgi:hypothetical protein